jgi:hypothetical protein
VILFLYIGCLLFDTGDVFETCETLESCKDTYQSQPSQEPVEPDVFLPDIFIIPEDTATPPVEIEFEILDVQPKFAMIDVVQDVVITGGPFEDVTSVLFGEQEGTVQNLTSESITVQTPIMNEEGKVELTVKTATSHESFSSFSFFTNEQGNTGAVGVFRLYSLLGNYWPVGTTYDTGDVEIYFLKAEELHWWQFFIPTLNSCMVSEYTTNIEYEVLDLEEPQIHIQTSNNPPLTLDWNTEESRYSLTGLTSNELPNDADFDLLPFTNLVEGFSVSQFVKTSQSVDIIEPVLDGNIPPMIQTNQHFEWTPSNASWIGITLAIRASQSDSAYSEIMTCMVEDTGSFTIDGSLYTQWSLGKSIDIYFSRYIEQESILPHNNSTARIAGEYVMFASGFTN